MTNGRYSIGLLINALEDDFANAVCRGAAELAAQLDADLFIFPGNNYQARISTVSDTLFNSQYATVFSYADKGDLDAVIISFSTIFRDAACAQAAELYERFRGIPIVTLCFERDGCGCVRYEPSAGLSELLDHLIGYHGCRRIAFVGGRKGNPDADCRLEAYRSALERGGIAYDPDYVAYGDFTAESRDVISAMLDRIGAAPDAICCANDRLASDAYKVAKKRGLRVGRDILITGYDNVIVSSSLLPALTTVDANPRQLGSEAVRLAIEMLTTGRTRTVTLPSSPIIRSSCGHHAPGTRHTDDGITYGQLEPFARRLLAQVADVSCTQLDSSALLSEFTALAGVVEPLSAAELCDTLHRIENRAAAECAPPEKLVQISQLFSAIFSELCSSLLAMNYRQVQNERSNTYFVNNMIALAASEQRTSLTDILRQVCRLKIDSSYIYLSPSPVPITDPACASEFDSLMLRAYHHGFDCFVPDDDITVDRGRLFSNEFVRRDRRSVFITVPLFTMNEQLGVAVFDTPDGFNDSIALTARQLSAALESLNMFSRLTSHIEDVEMRNSVLSAIATKDALTGLYNRYGFFERSELIARDPGNAGRRAFVAFIDMDNLKLTNDTFGHESGDYALQLINRALIAAFPKPNVVGRIGGDEFAAFIIPDSSDTEETICARFRDALDGLNAASGKPFLVTASIGLSGFRCDDEVTIRRYLEQADRNLYLFKQNKPTDILRRPAQ